jgi:hypothetical protein
VTKSKIAFLGLFYLAFSGCAGMLSPARAKWPALPNGFFMNVGTYIQITGTGKAADSVRTETLRKSLGRDAALLDSWRRMRRYFESFLLPSGRTVGQKAAFDKEYDKIFESLIHGAQIVSTHYDQDQTTVIILRVDRQVVQEILGTDYK